MQPAIGDGALIHPAAEHGADGAPELGGRILREGLTDLALDHFLVAGDDRPPILGAEIRVEIGTGIELVVVEYFLEQMMLDPQHDLPVHLDEAAVGIIGEALVAAAPRQALDRLVVEAEIEHRVHHAGHRGAGARADRDQQRVLAVAEAGADDGFDLMQTGFDRCLEILGILLPVIVEIGADLGRDGEAGRYGQAEIAHLGKIRALAAQ